MTEVDLQRQLDAHNRLLDKLLSNRAPATLGGMYGMYAGLPGLRGLWYPGNADDTGAVYDLSGQGRKLTYNGNPGINIYNNLVPYYDLDGTGDYLSRADEAGLDVLGTETYVAAALRGLTFGGWFWINAAATRYGLMNKYVSAGNQRSYSLWVFETGTLAQFYISVDGTATKIVASTAAMASAGWYFMVGRFTPSTELALFQNNTKYTNTTTISASIFNSTSAFEIGRFDGGSALAGRCALAFLCAAALPDNLIDAMFQAGRPLFGV